MNKQKQKQIVLTITMVYTTIMVYWMLWGFRRITYTDHQYNFIPFRAISGFFEKYIVHIKEMPDIAKNELWYFAVNIFGNIGMFIPFGVLLTILFNGSLKKAFSIFIFGVLMLEATQLISYRGVFDVDDILLNTIGFLIGYSMIKARSIYKKSPNQALPLM